MYVFVFTTCKVYSYVGTFICTFLLAVNQQLYMYVYTDIPALALTSCSNAFFDFSCITKALSIRCFSNFPDHMYTDNTHYDIYHTVWVKFGVKVLLASKIKCMIF